MKKYLSLLFIFAISATNTAMAYDFSAVAPSGQTLYYNIKGNGVTLTYPEKTTWGEDGWKGYVKPTGALIIPSTVTYNNINYSVTSIKEYAFYECEGLISVSIPNTVTYIGDRAFLRCSNLKSVLLPNCLDTIHDCTFMKCILMDSIVVPNSVTYIGKNAFSGSGLKYIIIPNSVTCIDNRAFAECNISNIKIPSSVIKIGGASFAICVNLVSVSIPPTINRIERNTFAHCVNLVNIDIDFSNINRIEEAAFLNCGLRGELSINPQVIGNNAFDGCTYLTSIILGDNVDSVYSNAFSKCSNVTNLSLGSGLKYIGSAAFKEMERVTSITCNSEEAPYVQNVDAFDGIPVNTPITIPCNTLNKYQYAYGWNRFTNFQSKMLYTFNVSSADPSKGSVQVMTQPTCENMQAYFQANAYNGFHFDHWSDGNTDNPRYLVLTGDTTIYAHFEVIQGIADVEKFNRCIIHSEDNRIVVSNTGNQRIRLFDCVGRCLSSVESPDDTYMFEIQSSGIYFVQVGNKRAQKVVVIR